jgi:hypothetical protein
MVFSVFGLSDSDDGQGLPALPGLHGHDGAWPSISAARAGLAPYNARVLSSA